MVGLRLGIGRGRCLCRWDFIVAMKIAGFVMVAVVVATNTVVAGGNWLRVEVRTKVVSGEPKVGVYVAEQGC